MLQILAKLPNDSRYLLVSEDAPTDGTLAPEAPARVLDPERGVLHVPVTVDSVMVRNPYYEPYDAAEGELNSLLEDVETNGPPVTEIGEPRQQNGAAGHSE